MQKHRYKLSFSLTTLLYGGVFLLYLYTLERYIAVSAVPEKEQSVTLALSQFVPEAPPSLDPEPVQKEQLVEPEPEPEKPEERIEEETPPKIEEKAPEPVVEKVAPLPPVVKKKVAETSRKPLKKKVRKKKKPRKKVHRVRRVSGGGSPHRSAAAKNAFLAKIRARINRAKSYPRIAQKRGMQGRVKAHFTILANGSVSSIRLSGPKVFHRSAKKAIRRAFPVKIPHKSLSFPMQVTLSLHYTLHK